MLVLLNLVLVALLCMLHRNDQYAIPLDIYDSNQYDIQYKLLVSQ